MGKYSVYIIVYFFTSVCHGQATTNPIFGGSWLNMEIVDYYNNSDGNGCLVRGWADTLFCPRSISFENPSLIRMTFFPEQREFVYRVIRKKHDSLTIHNTANTRKLYLAHDTLKLQYSERIVQYLKVSNQFSNDVFGDFIKNKIFERHKHYRISAFTESRVKMTEPINRISFVRIMKELFKCDRAEIVTLSTFKYSDKCLPEINFYFKEGPRVRYPRTLAILLNREEVEFIDKNANTVLRLTAN